MTRAGRFAEPAVFIILVILTFIFLPLPIALFADIIIIIAFLMSDAARNPLLFVMGMRNIARRKGATALIVCGLMIGTAIISASFTVGDTIQNMIVEDAAKGYGEVDFELGLEPEGNQRHFNATGIAPVVAGLRGIKNVESVRTLTAVKVGIYDNNTGLFSTAVSVYGADMDVFDEFGGLYSADGKRIIGFPQSTGRIYLNREAADAVEAQPGHIVIIGTGNHTMRFEVEKIADSTGFGGYGKSPAAYVPLETAQMLSGGGADTNNTILISLIGKSNDGMMHADTARAEIESVINVHHESGLVITRDRETHVETLSSSMSMFTGLFFIFGTFAIISGIALIVNIFTMVGEERKSELGIARAVGMRRKSVRRMLLYEGTIYAAVAVGIGAAVGIGIAYVITNLLGEIFGFGIDISKYFHVSLLSISISYMMGFLITLLTIYLSTVRISRINIVRAIRGIPEPDISRSDKKALRAGITVAGCGSLLLVIGIGGQVLVFAMSGLSLILLSLGFFIRIKAGDRIAWNVAGILTLIIWAPLINIFPYSSGIEMFIVSGIFMVSAAILLTIFNSDAVIRLFTYMLRVKSGYRAVVRTSMSYPLRAKFKTALSIFIFGLVIYTVTTLAVMTPMVEKTADNIVRDVSGGYDIIAFSNPNAPIDDLWENVNQTNGHDKSNITMVVSLTTASLRINQTSKDGFINERYPVYGFDRSLFPSDGQKSGYGLSKWDKKRYNTEREVWEDVLANNSLGIIDGTMSPPEGTSGYDTAMFATAKFSADVGDKIAVVMSDGKVKNITIVGIMRQFILTGVFMSKDAVNKTCSVYRTTMFLIDVKDGLSIDEQAKNLKRAFLYNGLETINVEKMSHEVSRQVSGIFGLFQAFLALGLAIGLAGLGLATTRSIYERRLEIGMMRAVGFRRSMVVASFALESVLVALLGIFIGTILGLITGYGLWLSDFRSGGVDFSIPWLTITTVAVISLIVTVISIYPAARGASRIPPAEALRYE